MGDKPNKYPTGDCYMCICVPLPLDGSIIELCKLEIENADEALNLFSQLKVNWCL